MTEIQEKLVDECLDEMNVTDTERRADFKNFLIQCSMFNPNVKWYNRIIGTKSNMKALYKKLDSPVKRASKILGLEYRELAEKIGYSEHAVKSAVMKGEVSKPMERAIELLIEVETYKKKCRDIEPLIEAKTYKKKYHDYENIDFLIEIDTYKKKCRDYENKLNAIENFFYKIFQKK